MVSNARRAAAMARAHVGRRAVGDRPSTSSVAGLMLSNVAPDSAVDELPVDQHPQHPRVFSF